MGQEDYRHGLEERLGGAEGNEQVGFSTGRLQGRLKGSVGLHRSTWKVLFGGLDGTGMQSSRFVSTFSEARMRSAGRPFQS